MILPQFSQSHHELATCFASRVKKANSFTRNMFSIFRHVTKNASFSRKLPQEHRMSENLHKNIECPDVLWDFFTLKKYVFMHFHNSSYAPRSQLHLLYYILELTRMEHVLIVYRMHCILVLSFRDGAHSICISKNGIPWVEITNVLKIQIRK
jgi:hypothetical protein